MLRSNPSGPSGLFLLFILLSLLLPSALASPVVHPRDDDPPLKTFDLTITWQDHAPDGFARKMFLINGQFPGPRIELTEGDSVQVTVVNSSPYNTTIHWHGLQMLNTPWADGVPGVSQIYIAPGASFVYAFTTTQHGNYWYHSHSHSQIDDGLYGPILIHPTSATAGPWSLISNSASTQSTIAAAVAKSEPLMLSDWQHLTSDQRWEISVESGIETPCFDSLLFNGKGSVQCMSSDTITTLTDATQKYYLSLDNATSLTAKGCLPGSVVGEVLAAGFATNLSAIPSTVFDVCTNSSAGQTVLSYDSLVADDSGTAWVALDIIGSMGLLALSFSIDETKVWVYAVDGAYIEPQLVDIISVNNGDRYSILVPLTTPGSWAIRAISTSTAQILYANAVLSHSVSGQFGNTTASTSTPSINGRGVPVDNSKVTFNQSTMKAYPSEPSVGDASSADQTVILNLRIAGHAYEWALNSTIYPMALDAAAPPLLFSPKPNRYDNVTITTKNDTWIDVIFIAKSPMPPHPIHKHTNKMYLIGQGTGAWTWPDVASAAAANPGSFNFDTPPHRDTLTTLDSATEDTWMVMRYQVVNPGAWLMHCHIETHLRGGMAVVIQDGIDKWPNIPENYLNYGNDD